MDIKASNERVGLCAGQRKSTAYERDKYGDDSESSSPRRQTYSC